MASMAPDYKDGGRSSLLVRPGQQQSGFSPYYNAAPAQRHPLVSAVDATSTNPVESPLQDYGRAHQESYSTYDALRQRTSVSPAGV